MDFEKWMKMKCNFSHEHVCHAESLEDMHCNGQNDKLKCPLWSNAVLNVYGDEVTGS